MPEFVDIDVPLWAWGVLLAVIVGMLAIDLVRHRDDHEPTTREALLESSVWIACGLAFSAVVAMQLCEPLATMIFSGALERHPGMRLVMAEAGLGWLPYFVHRMDASTSKRPGVAKDYQLRDMPSEIFRRQVYVTFEEEDDGATFIDMLGADNFMWASDFPHADSTFPESRASIAASFGALSPADCRKITADNCRGLYGFGLPTP